jgi:hypothetical protein
MSEGKDLLYKLVKQDSRNAANVGDAIGWDYLQEEGNRNVEDPSAALRKAAISAATWYLGGMAGAGAEGAAAGAAGSAALDAGITAGSELTAQQLAAMAMSEMTEPALAGAAQGVGQGLMSTAPDALGQGLMSGGNNVMESALTDSGYTPSSLYQALKNANGANGTPLSQNMGNYGKQLSMDAQNGSLLNRMGSNLGDKKSLELMRMGSGMMSPPQQQPMQAPPPQQPQQQGPLPTPYGDNRVGPGQSSMQMDPRFLTEEQKRRLWAQGVRI